MAVHPENVEGRQESTSIGSPNEAGLVMKDGVLNRRSSGVQTYGTTGFGTGLSKTGRPVTDPRALSESDTIMLIETASR